VRRVILAPMNPIRLGRSIRALRLRLRWRQRDLAERAAVGQQTVSDVERGRATTVGLPRLLRIAAALDADLDLVIRWRGGTLDRLLDERHAAMCAASAHRLRVLGLDVLIEVSYAYYAERGSIDVLGWRASTSTLVVVEVKTELTSIEATLRKHDEKIRLGPRIARDRFGQTPSAVVGLLVLSDDSTSRRRAARHEHVLGAAYPVRGRAAWALLASSASGRSLAFLPPTPGAGGRHLPVSRVRVSQPTGTRGRARRVGS
jgi:transcriptional regulator with XRE-family HTH domain